ncbi:hypothetical protein JDV02_001650 [Purpureocillium takamizusanense]|uniref:Uncharacterized protein n=1 Tax=Purpureocillium takamizusanense TaxID=2060973 RepID=A0A9Q8V815_9HYPO|nr:uncharacterized protein JDV02_001650 [Purpureocillium takamizusanense]UNI15081.1 hypothetical protein JDV02_001650 [Purpureocillium takamizusanense]
MRSVTAHTLAWTRFCASGTIFEGRVHSSKKYVRTVFTKYPSADLNSLGLNESYRLPKANNSY